MVRTRHRPAGLLFVVVLASATLAGCFDGKDDAGDETAPSPWDTSGPIPIEQYQRLYGPDSPDTCEGCIPLEAAPPEPVPAPEPPPSVQIPLPHIGDRLMVRGQAFDHPSLIRPHLPIEGDRDYRMALVIEEGAGADVRFVWSEMAAHWHGLPLQIHNGTWNVSLASRTLHEGTFSGTAGLQHPMDVTSVPATLRVEPPLETLFWLGAHLWGRTLTSGAQFATHWVAPVDGAVLAFDYLVLRAAPDSVLAPSGGHHRHHDPAGVTFFDAHVQAEVTDRHGNRARWSFYLSDESPYPHQVEGRLVRIVEPERIDLPMVAQDQIIDTYARGTADPGWHREIVRPLATPPPDDPGFLLGDRLASPVLDELVAYPLSTALSDLVRFERSYADYVQDSAERVLVAATHHVDDLTGLGGARHTWQVEFADRQGGVRGWTVARVSVGDVLLPAPDRYGTTGASWSPVVEALTDDPHLQVRLATGAPGAEVLRAHGITHVDQVVYRLGLVSAGTVGGTLEMSAYRADRAPADADASVGGHFVQDLATRRLVEVGLAN